ncbi:Protein of unknown function [Filimonas lacunae]|uniref:DUF3109 family protein n=1 Tax=Filimonas lacunae TaxID=477680 RepID=A0A173MNV1_9BACT|nr:DUF3109 family protein [Filimonas lacunae]BAV09323.1 hypothetical protein FLA_5371 [Filimonas lacunae]SIS71130.1 Protein of unknown function [Filimonas lacunae]
MIAIDNVLISDEVVEEQFVCDLTKCKGGCCEDGDAGAPLLKQELDHLNNYYEVIKPYMTPQGIRENEKQGRYVYDRHFGWVTPTIEGQICTYAFRDAQNVIKCGIEQAYLDGKLPWKKPISCHMFPIKMSQSEVDPSMEYLNYEPREDLCSAACKLGKKLKVPAYVFLKDAIIRHYGEEFYATLDATAQHLKEQKG